MKTRTGIATWGFLWKLALHISFIRIHSSVPIHSLIHIHSLICLCVFFSYFTASVVLYSYPCLYLFIRMRFLLCSFSLIRIHLFICIHSFIRIHTFHKSFFFFRIHPYYRLFVFCFLVRLFVFHLSNSKWF